MREFNTGLKCLWPPVLTGTEERARLIGTLHRIWL